MKFFKYSYEKVAHLISAILIGVTLVFSIAKTLNIPDDVSTNVLIKHYGNLLFLFFGVYVLIKLTLVLLEQFEVYDKPAFVLLTPEAEKAKTKSLSSYKIEWIKYLGTIAVSILIGIISNYIYQHYFIA